MRPLHVCHVILSLQPGGLENGVVNVVNGLDPAGFQSSICCLQRAGEFSERLRPDVRLATMDLRPGTDLRLPLRLARLLHAWRVDLVHTRNAEPFFYGVLAARLARVPVVIHSEHGRTFPERPLRRIAQRFLLRQVNGAFAVSAQLRSDLTRELGVPDDRFEVLHNGVDCSRFQPVPARLGPLEEPAAVRIGTVGRMVAVKNYPLLLRAFARLPAAPRCTLVLIGDGPDRGMLERVASVIGIRDQVEFVGHRDDVPRVLQQLDIFVLPSLSEGMSNTLLEAMATGLAVLASDVGGNSEIIQAERSGLLFRSGDVQAAADQLERLIRDAALRAALGRAAAARVRAHFGIEAMLRRYEALYRRVWERERGEPIVEAVH
jgi:sugar transferase (PEP-CTERM/EpsH1 system associated)